MEKKKKTNYLTIIAGLVLISLTGLVCILQENTTTSLLSRNSILRQMKLPPIHITVLLSPAL